jgi:hypothetical protein
MSGGCFVLPINYFFLYPEGHTGFTAVTFLTNLPLTQVMVIFLATGLFADSLAEVDLGRSGTVPVEVPDEEPLPVTGGGGGGGM